MTDARRTLLVATSNPGKLRELAALFACVPLTLVSLPDLPQPIPAPDETGDTFAANARLKAVAYAKASGRLCLADDSGFEVAVLDGAPGVHSARAPGGDDAGRVRWVYEQIQRSAGAASDRGAGSAAAFVCAMALAAPDGRILHETEGRVDGLIAPEPRGDHGFGYDPMFFYPPAGRTFAELTREEKAEVSHRGVAARRMAEWLDAASRNGSLLATSDAGPDYAHSMQRRLWFGLALFCAFGSIYAGLFGLSRVQYVLIAGAILTIVMGLRSPHPPEARPPGDPQS